MSTIGHWAWNAAAVLGLWLIAALLTLFGFNVWKHLAVRRYERQMRALDDKHWRAHPQRAGEGHR